MKHYKDFNFCASQIG